MFHFKMYVKQKPMIAKWSQWSPHLVHKRKVYSKHVYVDTINVLDEINAVALYFALLFPLVLPVFDNKLYKLLAVEAAKGRTAHSTGWNRIHRLVSNTWFPQQLTFFVTNSIQLDTTKWCLLVLVPKKQNHSRTIV